MSLLSATAPSSHRPRMGVSAAYPLASALSRIPPPDRSASRSSPFRPSDHSAAIRRCWRDGRGAGDRQHRPSHSIPDRTKTPWRSSRHGLRPDPLRASLISPAARASISAPSVMYRSCGVDLTRYSPSRATSDRSLETTTRSDVSSAFATHIGTGLLGPRAEQSWSSRAAAARPPSSSIA